MHFVKAKSILSSQNGINVYRGCTHGCIYCDSRSLCYHTPVPFENVEVKENAPELLEEALKKKRKKCMIGTGSMCDPYMHCEEKLGITRRCLEVIERYGFGAGVLTKSDLVLRDIELLDRINRKSKAVVQMTLTTFDDRLCKIIEPNVCETSRRIAVLEECRRRGIPTVVWFSPLLPFINDTIENLMGILESCAKAEVKGIICYGMGLTLRGGNREYFYAALDRYFPGMKEKYIKTFGFSYMADSPDSRRLYDIFNRFCRENGIICTPEGCFEWMRKFPEKNSGIGAGKIGFGERNLESPVQLELF